jgi:uncharacterized membrane protein
VSALALTDSLLTALKTAGVIALLVLVFVGGPILAMTGSLAHAWYAVRQYSKWLLWMVAIGGGLGLIAAFTG